MNLLQGPIRTIYYQYLFAAFGSAIITSIYSTVDMVVVGQYEGPVGTATLSCILPMFSLVISLGMLFGIGGSVMMSLARGRGNRSHGNGFFTVTFFSALVVSAAVTILFVLHCEDLLRLFGANDSLMPYALVYTKWLTMAIPMFLMGQVLVAFIRNDGAPFLATLSILLGGAFNIFGDIYFVFGLDMGIEGAGLATAMGQTLAILVLCTHFFRRKGQLHLAFPLNPVRALWQCLSAGFSPFLVDFSFGFMVMLFNNQIIRYAGTTELAVFGTIANCAILIQCLFYGVGQALQPIASLNFGARKFERVKQVLSLGLRSAIVMGILFFALVFMFPTPLLRLYMDVTPAVLAIGPGIVRVYSLSFLLMGINVVAGYYLQSILHTAASLLLSLLRGILLCTVFLLLLPPLFGFSTIWLTMPLTESFTLILSVFFLTRKQTHHNTSLFPHHE